MQVFEGFYATVRVEDIVGGRRVVKAFHRPGTAAREAVALAALGRMTPPGIAVPELISLRREGDREVMVQTYVPGVPLAEATPEPSSAAAHALAEQVVDVVTHWHAQEGTAFEDLRGGTHASFLASYSADVRDLGSWLEGADHIDPGLRERIRMTARAVPDLLRPLADDSPVFIHDDCHAGNFLVDPEGFVLTGVIDPGAARYSHRELDLFHLADGAEGLRLWERAAARRPLARGASERRGLFRIWDDVKHARATGWWDDEWFLRRLGAFEQSRHPRAARRGG